MKPNRVLIVDDEAVLCETLKEGLESFEIDSIISTDCTDAIRKSTNEKFSVIITDFFLGNKTAVDLVRLARSDSSMNKETPIILISGAIKMQDLVSIKKDLSAALMKPFPLEKLVDAVKSSSAV